LKNKLITIFLLFCVFNNYAQNAEIIQVKGIVVNKKLEPISFTHILIKNKRNGSVSNEFGKFDFFAEKGDTLIFSCVGYKKTKYIIPKANNFKIYYFLAMLQPDTIRLPEVLIFPWKTFKQFTEAFVKTEVPDDDIIRAEKNIELIKFQILKDDDDFSAPGAAYNIINSQRNSLLYWKGQSQPMQIFNVFAWQQFFDYLKNGKFKNKKNKN